MNLIVKINIFILVLFGIVVGISYSVVNSSLFKNWVLLEVNNILESSGVNLKSDGFNLSMFPPGISANNIVLLVNKKNIPVKKIKCDEALINPSLINIFSSKFEMSSITLKGLRVKLALEGEKSKSEFDYNISYLNEALKQIEKLPVKFREVVLEDSQLKLSQKKINIDYFSVKYKTNEINTTLSASSNHEKVGKVDVRVESVLRKDLLAFKHLEVDLNDVVIEGSANIKRFNDVKLESSIIVKGDFSERLKDLLPEFIKNLSVKDHQSLCSIKISKIKKIVECKTELLGLESDFVDFKKLNLNYKLDNEGIDLLSLEGTNPGGSVNVKTSYNVFSFDKKSFFTNDNLILKLTNFSIKNGVQFIKPLQFLSGSLTGKFKFEVEEESVHFETDDIIAKNLSIAPGGKSIIEFKDAQVSEFNLSIYENLVSFSSEVLVLDDVQGSISIKGSIDDNIQINSKGERIDLAKSFGLKNLGLKGISSFNVGISNQEDEIVINANTRTDKLHFFDFYVDNAFSIFEYRINENKLYIKDFLGQERLSTIVVSGAVDLGSEKLDLNFSSPNMLYNDFIIVYPEIKNHLSFLPKNFDSTFMFNGKLNGTFDNIILTSNVKQSKINIFNETIEEAQYIFHYNKESLSVKDIAVKAFEGTFNGDFNYSFKDSFFEIKGFYNNFNINSINTVNQSPLNLQANLSGNIYYKKGVKSESAKVDLTLKETLIGNNKVKNSELFFASSMGQYFLDANLFGKAIQFTTLVDVEKKNKSEASFDINIDDLKTYLPMIKGIDAGPSARGALITSMKSEFQWGDIDTLNCNFQLPLIYFEYRDIKLKHIDSQKNDLIAVKNGVVDNWDIKLKGNSARLISQGKGSFSKEVEVNNRLYLSASFLELFNEYISYSNGSLNLLYDVKKEDNNKLKTNLLLTSNNLKFASPFLPLAISNIDLITRYRDRSLLVEKFKIDLDQGEVNLGGSVDFKEGGAFFNISYNSDEALVKPYPNTRMYITSEGRFIGSNPPYLLSGKVNLAKGVISDELNVLIGDNVQRNKNVRFMPLTIKEKHTNSIDYNISIRTQESIKVKNSLLDLGVNTDIVLLGGDDDFRLSGMVDLEKSSAVTFQNNVYSIEEGEVSFSENQEVSNPTFRFEANSNISEYEINAKLSGQPTNYILDLDSNPKLNKESILSLIAFGHTGDVNDNLNDEEREALTTASIGSLLFDQFKIAKEIQDEFDLKVNLGTEVFQDQGAIVQQGVSNQLNTSGSRTATKLEVRKELKKDLSLSVTSTVGGTAGERQRMNLNYQINNNYSLEGVYQSRTSVENEQDINGNGVGADIKFKWSFK